MELFTAARYAAQHSLNLEMETTTATATAFYVVVVDCASERVGVHFGDFMVGMDCGVQRLADIMARVDALADADRFSIKLGHVLAALPAWHDERACAVWGSVQSRATAVWITLGLLALARHFYRRRAEVRTHVE